MGIAEFKLNVGLSAFFCRIFERLIWGDFKPLAFRLLTASEGALPKLHSFPVADRHCPPIRTNLAYLVCWTFDPAFKLNRSFYMGFYRDWFGKVLSAAIQSGSAKNCGMYNVKGN